MQQMAEQDFVPCEAFDQAAVATLLSTAAAFHRWKQAKLKTSFKKQLSEILEDVDSEQNATKKLKQQIKKSQARESELLEQLSDLQAELSNTNTQMSQQHADIHELTTVVDALEAHAAALEQRAAAAEAAYAAERGRSTALQQQHQRELQEVKQEQQGILKQQQALMHSLAQRDQQMAQLAAELKAAKTAAATAAQQLQQMEGVVHATGKQAAAAEDGLQTSTELVVRLQQQLADMKDRYHMQLEQLRPLRAAASESAALKDRLAEASAAAAALAAGRDDMQRQLDAASAGLAAATEQQRQLEQAAGIKETITEAGFAGDPVGVLSQHLDNSQAQVATLAPRLAASEAAIQQQQRHIQQLATQLDRAQHARSAAVERGEVLQLLNVQLQAEVRRLAALAGVPVGDWTGTMTVEPTAMGNMADQVSCNPAISTALLLSQLQESLDNLEATKRSMVRSKPKVTAAAQQATGAAAAVNQISTELQQVISRLQPSRTQQQQQQKEPAVLAAVVVSSRQQILDLLKQQVQQVKSGLEEIQPQLQQEQQHWQQVFAAAAAAAEVIQRAAQRYSRAVNTEDPQGLAAGVQPEHSGSLHPTLQQLQAADSQLARVLNRSGSRSSGHLSGEMIFTAAAAARDISAMLLELLRLLEGSLAGNDSPPAKSEAAGDSLNITDVARSLEVAAARADAKLQVIQSCSVFVSSSLAELSSVVAYLHTAQQQATAATSQLEQLQHLLQAQAENVATSSTRVAPSGSTKQLQQQQEPRSLHSTSDLASKTTDETVATLEVEVAALQLQLQRREVEVQRLMAREKQLLSGTAELIPTALLSAARSQQDDLAARVAALQQQAAAQQYAAEVYVDRAVARYKVQRLVEAWLVWRLAAAQGRADRVTLELSEAQASLQHAVEQQQQRSAAVADLLKRQVRAAGVQQQQQMAAEVIAAWQRQATRQVHATWLWRGLSELLLQQHNIKVLTYQHHHQHQQQQQQGWLDSSNTGLENSTANISKSGSLAAAIVRRKQRPHGSCLWSVEAGQLLSLVFGAWRSFEQLESKTRVAQQKLDYAEQLSAGLPAWIQQIGDKRRLERSWLAWRLATAAAATARAAAAVASSPAVPVDQFELQQEQRRTDHPAPGGEPNHVTESISTVEAAGPAAMRNLVFDSSELAGHLLQDPNNSSSSSKLQQPWRPDGEALPQPPAAAVVGQPSPTKQIVRAAASSPSSAAAGVENLTDLDDSSPAAPAALTVPTAEPVRIQRPKSLEGTASEAQSFERQQQQQKGPLPSVGSEATTSPTPATKVSRIISQNRKQQLRLRGGSSSGNRSGATEVNQRGKSPPAGLLLAAKAATLTSKQGGSGSTIPASMQSSAHISSPTKVISSPSSKVPPVNILLAGQPKSASPGTTSHSRAAFGRTVKSGEWAPAPSKRSAAAAAAGSSGSADTGTAFSSGGLVAGLADKTAARRQDTVGVSHTAAGKAQVFNARLQLQQQQQQHAASEKGVQPGPAETLTAGAGGVPAASNVIQHLAAITCSLAVMQQQVQTRSRAIFQAGADALHPAAAVDERPQTSQQLQQQQQQQLPILSQHDRQQGYGTRQLAAGGILAHRGGSRKSGGLQQQLEGCQQHLQQITSSLRVASRPWLYSGLSQTEELTSVGQAAGVAAAAAAGGEGEEPAAEGGGSLSGHQQATSSTGLQQLVDASLAFTACSSTSTAGGSNNSGGVNLAALLTTAAAAAGEHKQSRTGNDIGPLAKASASLSGAKASTTGAAASPKRARSPAIVIDTRSPQVGAAVASNPGNKADSVHSSPLRPCPGPAAAAGGGGGGRASPEWHVVGQPRKSLLPPGAAAGLRGRGVGYSGEMVITSVHQHTTDAPVTTYIRSHSSTPGPGSPPKTRTQHSPSPRPAARVDGADTIQQPASSSHEATARFDHASPEPQMASNLPQPYRPAEDVQWDTVHSAQPQATQLNGRQRGSAGVTPGVSSPEPGVVRFERLNMVKPAGR